MATSTNYNTFWKTLRKTCVSCTFQRVDKKNFWKGLYLHLFFKWKRCDKNWDAIVFVHYFKYLINYAKEHWNQIKNIFLYFIIRTFKNRSIQCLLLTSHWNGYKHQLQHILKESTKNVCFLHYSGCWKKNLLETSVFTLCFQMAKIW